MNYFLQDNIPNSYNLDLKKYHISSFVQIIKLSSFTRIVTPLSEVTSKPNNIASKRLLRVKIKVYQQIKYLR